MPGASLWGNRTDPDLPQLPASVPLWDARPRPSLPGPCPPSPSCHHCRMRPGTRSHQHSAWVQIWVPRCSCPAAPMLRQLRTDALAPLRAPGLPGAVTVSFTCPGSARALFQRRAHKYFVSSTDTLIQHGVMHFASNWGGGGTAERHRALGAGSTVGAGAGLAGVRGHEAAGRGRSLPPGLLRANPG